MANVFKIAKQLRKKHPNKSWQSLVKEAGRKARGSQVRTVKKSGTAVKRKAAPRKRKVATTTRKSSSNSIPGLRSKLKEQIKGQLASALLRKDLAKKKRDKNKHQKSIVKYRRELKYLSGEHR